MFLDCAFTLDSTSGAETKGNGSRLSGNQRRVSVSATGLKNVTTFYLIVQGRDICEAISSLTCLKVYRKQFNSYNRQVLKHSPNGSTPPCFKALANHDRGGRRRKLSLQPSYSTIAPRRISFCDGRLPGSAAAWRGQPLPASLAGKAFSGPAAHTVRTAGTRL